MNAYSKLLELSQDGLVKLADNFREKLHTHLALGQTRFVCRYGTLSDGHEKITDAQRYYQAIKEMWHISGSIQSNRIEAKLAHADYLDALEACEKATKESEKIRCEALKERAELKMLNFLTTVEDLMRQLDEYNKVRIELQEKVETKYPKGMEQAESDNWKAVAYYRYLKGDHERMDNVPLPPEEKAKLGFLYERRDMVAPFVVYDQKKAKELQEFLSNDKLSLGAQS